MTWLRDNNTHLNGDKKMPESEKLILIKGEKYNWIHQKERLIYLGLNFSGNGFWHQFAKVETPSEVWSECQPTDLLNIERTTQDALTKQEIKAVRVDGAKAGEFFRSNAKQ